MNRDYEDYDYIRTGGTLSSLSVLGGEGVTRADLDKLFQRSSFYASQGGPKALKNKRNREEEIDGTLPNLDDGRRE